MESDNPSDQPAEPSAAPVKRRRSRKRVLVWLAIALLILFIGAELFARFYLGLGDPPLYVADPQIEYLNKPSMHYRRFGNSITYNAYSMRSGPLEPKKTDPNQLRVLVVGDSIVNGGAPTDDSKLATAILQSRLSDALKRPVYVGNISAGSWGPPNELAYLKRFGFFDAAALVLVFNSTDYDDVPTFEPTVGVSPEQPDHTPLLALQEGFARYLLPRLRASAAPDPNAIPTTRAAASPEAIRQCMDAIRDIVALAHTSGVKQILIVQHPDARELAGSEWPGHAIIAQTSRDLGIEPIQLAPAFAGAMRSGQNPYRDGLHPNDLGQQLIADTLFDPLKSTLSK